MIQSAGKSPYRPSHAARRPVSPVKAGGGHTAAPVGQPAPAVAGVSVLQQVVSALMTALSGFVAWLRNLLRPQAPAAVAQPMGPMPSGRPTAANPVDAPFTPLPGMALQQGQGAIAGAVTRDTTLVAGQVAARVGENGSLRAAGLYQDGPQGIRANVQAAYSDPTTEAGARYTRQNDIQSAGGYVNKALPHSSLSLGADYLWSPAGDGGRAYGRWQSDAIGEKVGGYTVRGALEAGAVKMPGQDWNSYAAGRVTAEKENAALFAEINHQAGPGFSQPDTSLKFGAQFRF